MRFLRRVVFTGCAGNEMNPEPPAILYCNCTYAQVIDPAAKAAVLRRLCDSGRSFEAVADLCEMSARRDPALARLAGATGVKIAACYPRAVKWLFASAGAALDPTKSEVVNLREVPVETAVDRLLAGALAPNLPTGKPQPTDAPTALAGSAAAATLPSENASSPSTTAAPAAL